MGAHDFVALKPRRLRFRGSPGNEPPDATTGYIERAEVNERWHTQIEPETGTVEETKLFLSAGLELHTDLQLSVRVDAPERFRSLMTDLDVHGPLGGERRLVHWKSASDHSWSCPSDLAEEIDRAPFLRMVLATPAYFRGGPDAGEPAAGWKPGWLRNEATGSPPGCNMKLKLVGVCSGRWQAISGWSLEHPPGPKPVRRLVPAGSVYFFEVIEPDPQNPPSSLWLKSVSDEDEPNGHLDANGDGQNRRDGLGLALWGTWRKLQDYDFEKGRPTYAD